MQYPVCHKNAQTLDGGRMRRTAACDGCGLCEATCPAAAGCDSAAAERAVFSDPRRLNVFFSAALPHCRVGSEIKVGGNARTKRIDLVIAHERTLLFVKAIQSAGKYPLYARSYDEVIAGCAQAGCAPEAVVLLPSDKLPEAEKLGYACDTLATLLQRFGG